MRTMLLSAVTLGVITTAALAEPVKLTDRQMDTVTAGVLDNIRLGVQVAAAIQASAPITANTVASVGILAEDVKAAGAADVRSTNVAQFVQSADLSGDVSD